ncbi:MAG: response regulator [Patescibacteria group bacterium]|nr:response regulator [Patescibacteria group bacterium]
MGKKILVIEDDKFLRKVISLKLDREGYEVSEAVDGEKGAKKIKEEKPDLILLDLILPGIDGFEVLSKIKTDSALSKIPIIILSNLGQKDDIEKGIKMGANDYLIKAHFTPDEIIEKIKLILD